ncbi:hypothetical protein L0F63_001553 [Massospora cicadina]|nr:hypothetical protein L0F63_001553 [Massospora cicadina]
MSVSLVVHNEDELHQIAESLKTNRTKLTVLELSMYIRFNNFPTSLNSLFSGLSELAIGMEPDGIVTRDFLPEFKSSCLRILRIELSQIHFSFIQSIPERFPQLKHLSIVGRIQAPSINQNRPPAFHNLSLLELELYSDVAIEPIAFLGDKKLNLTTLFISSECMLDHGKVVDLLKTPWPALRSLTLGGASNMRLKDFTPLSRLTHLQLDFSLFNLTPLLGHMFEAMPHLKSIEFTAKISDQGFENLVSVPNLAKVALCGFLDLGFHFISWLFRLPYLQKLLLHSHPGGLFKVEVDPNAFVGVLPSLLVIETPQPPCALSEFLQMHAPNLISVRDSSPDV